LVICQVSLSLVCFMSTSDPFPRSLELMTSSILSLLGPLPPFPPRVQGIWSFLPFSFFWSSRSPLRTSSSSLSLLPLASKRFRCPLAWKFSHLLLRYAPVPRPKWPPAHLALLFCTPPLPPAALGEISLVFVPICGLDGHPEHSPLTVFSFRAPEWFGSLAVGSGYAGFSRFRFALIAFFFAAFPSPLPSSLPPHVPPGPNPSFSFGPASAFSHSQVLFPLFKQTAGL